MAEQDLDASDLIYHYCSPETFIKIIEGGALRLSNIFFMNDSLEYVWLQQLMLSRIDAMLKEPSQPLPHVLQNLDRLRKRFSNETPEHVYCCCFSGEGDLLSQWRSYASDGNGYALGFSRRAIIDRMPCEQKNCLHLTKVEYDPAEHQALVDLALSGSTTFSAEIDDARQSLATVFTAAFAVLGKAAECKNPAFSEEREWRLIYKAKKPVRQRRDTRLTAPPPISRMKFYARGGQIVPYFEYGHIFDSRTHDCDKWRTTALKHIVVGPRNRSPENTFAIRLLLEENMCDPERIKIDRSKASYR